MKTIKIDKTIHRGEEVVLIQFPYDNKLGEEAKKIKNIRWSKSLKAWHVPYSIAVLNEIKTIFDCISIIDAQALKETIAKEKALVANKKVLSAETIKQIEKFKSWMLSRRYSESTIGTYTDALRTFLKFYHTKAIADISNDDVIEFNNKYIMANKLSASFQNQVVNAIKLFFRTMQNVNMNPELIHRPKNPKLLPNVLSKEEVQRILKSTKNFKHKTALSLIYSCGLRRGELLSLKLMDVHYERNLLNIRSAKGNKDRIAPLSDKMINVLRNYITEFKPKTYLFEGWIVGEPYSEKSLQQVLKNSVILAKINKPISLHWLRHSYATHVLENGTDLRYIQEILGHKSSKTTEIYTHVSTKSIQKIKSPFDDLEL